VGARNGRVGGREAGRAARAPRRPAAFAGVIPVLTGAVYDGAVRATGRHVAVVVPCYGVRASILRVLEGIGPDVASIWVVDDACPEGSGAHVDTACGDPRVRVLRHEVNRGVGGATVTGFRAALAAGADVVVKLDGDGQMDPSAIPALVDPILRGRADYVKGNRFWDLDTVRAMPLGRKAGNAVVSLLAKAASGYWNLMDATNGFVAVDARVLSILPLDKLDRRWFFENDLLFRLGTVQAVVTEMPMTAVYAGAPSHLSEMRAALQFPGKFAGRFLKRIGYAYFLRSFTAVTVELVVGATLLGFGGAFGTAHWWRSIARDVPATTGTVMLAALPVILGFQLLLAALNQDIANVPTEPLQRKLPVDREALRPLARADQQR